MNNRVLLRAALVGLMVCLSTFTRLSPAHSKMIADTIVIFGAINGIQGVVTNEAVILYNPTPRDVSLQGYFINGFNQDVWANLGSNDTIGAFGFLVIGDSDVNSLWVDSPHTIANVNGNDSISLRLGATFVDFWEIDTGTGSGHHGSFRETAPVNFTDNTFLYRSPALVRNWTPSTGGDTPFGGGGMINRSGLSDIFEDTRTNATTDGLGFLTRRHGSVDRMIFICTAPTSVREGAYFSLSCTAVIRFGERSFDNWEGSLYKDSIVVHYTGNLAVAECTVPAGVLGGLATDSRFTTGLLNNYSISINDTRNGVIRMVFEDAYCTGYLNLTVLADTVSLFSPPHSDTVGGRSSAFSIRLQHPIAVACTTIFEYDTYNSGTYDSITFSDSEWGLGQAAPDSTPTLSSDTNGREYTLHWNVQSNLPDTWIPTARLRVRVWNANVGTYIGETILTPMRISTVIPDPPDTPDAVSLEWGESVQITWKQDTYGKYFVVWRDTGPTNDTERFINVTRMVLGTDSQADFRGLSLIDTHVGRAPGKRVPALDTYFNWYITAIDTWGNTHDRPYGYGDSIPAEYLYVKKTTDSPSIKGRPSDTIPGASIGYHILVSNTPGYSPIYRTQLFDYIPLYADYRGTSVEMDTRYRFDTQTDIIDADYARFVHIADSQYLQIDLYQPFNPGDTARIRFKVIIR